MISTAKSRTRRIVRKPSTGSAFSNAVQYLKSALAQKRCMKCHWTGHQKCLQCKGKGTVLGDGWFIPGCSAIFTEPCRRCIGTGKEDCHCCGGATSLPPTNTSHL